MLILTDVKFRFYLLININNPNKIKTTSIGPDAPFI